MASLEHSSGALDTLPLFHGKRLVVYVEGPDDVPFWDAVFKVFGLSNYHIKPAGGSPEVEKYSLDIVRDDVDIVVARDCEFCDLMGTKHQHPRIIYTYGHSIENTFFSPAILSAIIAGYARVQGEFEETASSWLDDLANAAHELLVLELANAIYTRGLEIMGDACQRFLPSRAATSLCPIRVANKAGSASGTFNATEVELARTRLNESDRKPRWWIRGHFLTGAVVNFVKSVVRSESGRSFTMSHDNLYVTAVAFLAKERLESEDRLHLEACLAALVA